MLISIGIRQVRSIFLKTSIPSIFVIVIRNYTLNRSIPIYYLLNRNLASRKRRRLLKNSLGLILKQITATETNLRYRRITMPR